MRGVVVMVSITAGPPAFTVAEEKLHPVPCGSPEQARVTAAGNGPYCGLAVMLKFTEPPATMVVGPAAAAAMLKSVTVMFWVTGAESTSSSFTTSVTWLAPSGMVTVGLTPVTTPLPSGNGPVQR